MTTRCKAAGLRRKLAHHGLLRSFGVYRVTAGDFGLPQAPVYLTRLTGYLYAVHSHYRRETLAIPGSLPDQTTHSYRMITFEADGAEGNLIYADGQFYRIVRQREILPGCRLLELEVAPDAPPD